MRLPLVILIAVGVFLGAAAYGAQSTGTNAPPPAVGASSTNQVAKIQIPANLPPALRKQMEKLPPAEQQKLITNWKQFQQLPPDERKMLQNNFQRFRNMTPQQRAQLRENLKQYQAMSEEDKRKFEENLERWLAMTPQQREQLRKQNAARHDQGQRPASSADLTAVPVLKATPVAAEATQ